MSDTNASLQCIEWSPTSRSDLPSVRPNPELYAIGACGICAESWAFACRQREDDLVAALRRLAEVEAELEEHKASHLTKELLGKEVVVNHPRYRGKGILVRVDRQMQAIAYVKLEHGEDRWYEADTVRPLPPAPTEAQRESHGT